MKTMGVYLFGLAVGIGLGSAGSAPRGLGAIWIDLLGLVLAVGALVCLWKARTR